MSFLSSKISIVMDSLDIIKGEDRQFELGVINADGSPFDLTGVDIITATFKGSSSNVVLTNTDSEISFPSPANGRMTLTISDTKSALLKSGSAQSFELSIEDGSNKRICQSEKVLNNKEKL